MLQLQLDQKLTALGFNKVELAAAIGNIIGRVVSPGSELHTLDWLQSRSALGELFDHDYGSTSLTRLYTISDKLLTHQTALESFLSNQEQTLFDLNHSIVLYDLTNTYFEGQCEKTPKAQFGRSKEKLQFSGRKRNFNGETLWARGYADFFIMYREIFIIKKLLKNWIELSGKA